MAWTRAREEQLRTPEHIDIKLGRIQLFDGVNHIRSDYDSIMHSEESRIYFAACGYTQSSSAPHAHWQNPAENDMKKSKHIALSLLNNALRCHSSTMQAYRTVFRRSVSSILPSFVACTSPASGTTSSTRENLQGRL
jgi:hypothetical protein